MAELFGRVERCLYTDLRKGKNITDLKREYQHRFGIDARFFNSVSENLKGKIKSRAECLKNQIGDLEQKIKKTKKKIEKIAVRLEYPQNKLGEIISPVKKKWNSPPCCHISRKKKGRKRNLAQSLRYQKTKLQKLEKKLRDLSAKKDGTLIFGGKKLWKAQFNLKKNGYANHEEWLCDWRKARSGQFFVVGSSDETAGCQNCQLDTESNLTIKVPTALQSKYGKKIKYGRICETIYGVKFLYGQAEIDSALSHQIAISYRFVLNKNIWYLNATTEREVPAIITEANSGVIGVDLNPSVIGWARIDAEGNLADMGQYRFSILEKRSTQTSAILGDIVKSLVKRAREQRIPICVEKLDFSAKKKTMSDNEVRYNRMLSNFAYKKFYQLLVSRASRFGVEVITVNPAYSSVIGVVKFMSMYGMSSDTAAAMVLARRARRFSERCPANYARFGAVQKKRHVWSTWAKLNRVVKSTLKKLGRPIRRHDYFSKRGTNSPAVVTLLEVIALAKSSTSKSKKTSASACRRDSCTRTVVSGQSPD